MSVNSEANSSNPLIRAGVLRPSVLGSSLNHTNNSTFGAPTLIDAKEKESVKNPFLKGTEEEPETDNETVTSSAFGKVANNNEKDTAEQADEEQDERPDPLTLLRKNGMERTNLFAATKSSVRSTGFVFGQNVHERVVGENIKPDSSSKSQTADSTSGELLFSSVIQNATKTADATDEASGSAEASSSDVAATMQDNNETKSLTEVAREYEESRAQKRKFEEVETFTGEENEVNIVDISCKLFAFVNSNWEERGRGSLRLNDSKTEEGCSRVVFRTSGNLRLLLNTKVWAGMVAERPSQKSLRLTAMDNTGKIKVFLAQARPVEISQLHKALTQRIDLRKTTHPGECYANTIDNNGSNDQEDNDDDDNASSKNGAVSSTDNLCNDAAAAVEEKNSEKSSNPSDHDDNDGDDDDDNDNDGDDDDNDLRGPPSPKKSVEEKSN